MFVHVACPNCSQNLPVPIKVKGQLARCPYCQEVFQVPRVLVPWGLLFHRENADEGTGAKAAIRAIMATLAMACFFGLIVSTLFLINRRRADSKGTKSSTFEEAKLIEIDERAKALADEQLNQRRLDQAAERPIVHWGEAKPTAMLDRRDPLDNLADLVELVEPSVIRINTFSNQSKGTASGFVVDPSGIIVTNYHVLKDVEIAHVVFHDSRFESIEGYLHISPERDLALLKITTEMGQIRPLALAPTQPRKGEEVAAFGAPLGLSFSTTRGIISGIRSRTEMISAGLTLNVQWIQTDASISVGNSGGPLVNMRGEVVGVNTVTSRGSAHNLNFAISADDVRKVLGHASRVPIPLGKAGLR